MAYVAGLALLSLGVAFAEALRPWRRDQARLRPRLLTDVAFLIVNGHFLGVVLFAVSSRFVLPPLDRALHAAGLHAYVYRNVAAAWPLWAQLFVLIVGFDLVQWAIHRLLHAVPWLWRFHQVHHSVVDGEMDWIVSFRFHWAEAVVYKSLQYLPLAFFGFSATAVLVQALVGTAMGHLNHANLDLGHGRWRYVLNSPRMHLWHHAAGVPPRNFGIIFSIWDWLFGTAYLPASPPARLGFDGDDVLPGGFLALSAWPVQRLHRDRP